MDLSWRAAVADRGELPVAAAFRSVLRFADGVTAQPMMVHDEATDFMAGADSLTQRNSSRWWKGFRRHGVPWRFAVTWAPDAKAPVRRHTAFTIWLMRVRVLVDFETPAPSAPPVRIPWAPPGLPPTLPATPPPCCSGSCGTSTTGSGNPRRNTVPLRSIVPAFRNCHCVISLFSLILLMGNPRWCRRKELSLFSDVVQLGRAFPASRSSSDRPQTPGPRVFFIDQYLGGWNSPNGIDEIRPLNLRPD